MLSPRSDLVHRTVFSVAEITLLGLMLYDFLVLLSQVMKRVICIILQKLETVFILTKNCPYEAQIGRKCVGS